MIRAFKKNERLTKNIKLSFMRILEIIIELNDSLDIQVFTK